MKKEETQEKARRLLQEKQKTGNKKHKTKQKPVITPLQQLDLPLEERILKNLAQDKIFQHKKTGLVVKKEIGFKPSVQAEEPKIQLNPLPAFPVARAKFFGTNKINIEKNFVKLRQPLNTNSDEFRHERFRLSGIQRDPLWQMLLLIFSFELVNAASSIQEHIFTGKERV